MRDKLIELIVNKENELFRQRNYFTDMERIEVIGKIHDNPELLEGEG